MSLSVCLSVRAIQEIEQFRQEAKSSPKVLHEDRGKAVDNGLSVGKVVQFLLYGKNASSVSREYVWHAWVSTGDDFVRRPAAH